MIQNQLIFMTNSPVGIDDMSLYVPQLYLSIEDLAKARHLEYAKLNKGLGLTHMAIPDVHEDAATMAANAVADLIDKNDINPRLIGRIYLGTESALDGAKPTATYLLEMLRRKYRATHGVDCLRHCDVVDLTFACVGGVDALQNTLDWVRGNKDRMGIVVCSDFAKYELASTGEYTQGAGAVAMLVKHQPRLLMIEDLFGVATMGVHDFFKPKRKASKLQLVEEVLKLANLTDLDAAAILKQLPNTLAMSGVLDDNDEVISLHKDTPIFDGQYSNWTYQNRIREAFNHFKEKSVQKGKLSQEISIIDEWERLIFHLPYAFHGKRIFAEIFMLEKQGTKDWDEIAANLPTAPQTSEFEEDKTYQKAYAKYLRAITKTAAYRNFVQEKMEKSQRASSYVGNMYACSIFLALMSSLEADGEDGTILEGKKIGFFGYGSGSKSKVFEATIQAEWKEVVRRFNIMATLAKRTKIDYQTYENLHRGRQKESVVQPAQEFVIDAIGQEGTRLGARYYVWKAEVDVLV